MLCVSPGCEMHANPVLLETDRQSSTFNTPIGFDFATAPSSSPGVPFLCQPLRQGSRVANWTEMAATIL